MWNTSGARHQPELLLPPTAILAQRWPSTGSRTEAYQVVWTGRCDWDCDSVPARIARLGLLYGHRSGENQGRVNRASCGAMGSLAYGRVAQKWHRGVHACSLSEKIKNSLGKKMPPFAGFRLVIADHAFGLPVLRTLSLCTCCRHYPGAAAGRTLRSASHRR